MSKNFALMGAAGYIAPRHLKAIHDTGNRLVAATDPHDAVGVLDRYFPEAKYFPEIERFDRHLEKLRRGPEHGRAHWVSICSPNYLHDAHIRMALRLGADAICEKPLVINPWNLDYLAGLEKETGHKVHTVLQLRVHPELIKLKAGMDQARRSARHDVVVTYVTGRGPWFQVSWKGSEERSGGLAANIGVHFFDLLVWIFGKSRGVEVHLREPKRMAGFLDLENADVRWFLSVDFEDLKHAGNGRSSTTYRSITVDGNEVEFTEGFTDLHTRVYEMTLHGSGFGIDDSRPSIELVHGIRQAAVSRHRERMHPLVGTATRVP